MIDEYFLPIFFIAKYYALMCEVQVLHLLLRQAASVIHGHDLLPTTKGRHVVFVIQPQTDAKYTCHKK